MNARVSYVDFPAQHKSMRAEVRRAVDRVLTRGNFILGEEVEAFEKRFAALCGVQHAIGVANGTDALILAFKALGIGAGDEVITAPNSFIASASSIALAGARPVFADVGPDLNIDPERIERAITPKTRAILPVHLTGRVADMDPILKIAERRRLYVIEDAAQSVGSLYRNRPSGSFGVMGCFSLHPLKNLNAAGDAGAITTNDGALCEKMKLLRNHGLRTRDEVAVWGLNSRLDTLQAAVLNCRLAHLDKTIRRRRQIAARYRRALSNVVECPAEAPHEFHTWHLFVIQCDRRDELQAHLARHGIESKIHYPIPLHLQPCSLALGYHKGDFPVCERLAGRILSIPVHQYLTNAQVDSVCKAIRQFYKRKA
ncbi:MAG: hypothetical protein A3G34_11710 [Candidatus Lindowbacteria bacterium RIFCSPLOWO2_12_FULL_62_27]|nr:MAG: hypothetical protein A3I06_02275 [Candidatus Lindowbacteria bacterium RIFCSPLOWO2_02_FULL_62_12]OGH60917.1 MAG: hypothetical protein A3G34_11710 [Candidatus Lindowbacteria bacterium RIFCSPLOWO2_12_FULL_62_27]